MQDIQVGVVDCEQDRLGGAGAGLAGEPVLPGSRIRVQL